ncbi:MAG TPA: DUF72 domain-containing protein [Tepidisphaeraceae bacterium]|jgi:uncharacterized protein YecE (DUF72 family)
MPETRIGISGWRYEPWRGGFYPPKLPQNQELHFASRALNSIELNGTFYSLQRPGSYRAWYDDTPDEFVFSVKGGQFITHILRLNNVAEPLCNFYASGLLLLKEKLGPILWQFPPNFIFDEEKFANFFALLPHDTQKMAELAERHGKAITKDREWLQTDKKRPVRHAVEIRHESFCTDHFVTLLRKHHIALVIADTARRFPYLEDITADFVYARLHGDEELYASGYTDEALGKWAAKFKAWQAGDEPPDARRVTERMKKLSKGRDLFIYFDNDIKVRAPFDAMSLAKRLGVGIDFDQVKSEAVDSGRPKKPKPKRRKK